MEKLQLWYCDNIAVAQSYQFYFMTIPVIGAYLYGQGKTKIGWVLIGVWVAAQILLSALTNVIFDCVLPD